MFRKRAVVEEGGSGAARGLGSAKARGEGRRPAERIFTLRIGGGGAGGPAGDGGGKRRGAGYKMVSVLRLLRG